MMKNKQSGFSLIELLIAMLIGLALVFVCTSVYSTLQSSILASKKLSEAQESLQTTFHLISRSVRQAESYTITTASLSGSVVTHPALSVTYGEIPSGSSIYSCLGNNRVQGNKDIYFSDSNNLYCNDGVEPYMIALSVNTLNFEAIDENGVLVKVKIDGMPTNISKTDGFEIKLALRQKIMLYATSESAAAPTTP